MGRDMSSTAGWMRADQGARWVSAVMTKVLVMEGLATRGHCLRPMPARGMTDEPPHMLAST